MMFPQEKPIDKIVHDLKERAKELNCYIKSRSFSPILIQQLNKFAEELLKSFYLVGCGQTSVKQE